MLIFFSWLFKYIKSVYNFGNHSDGQRFDTKLLSLQLYKKKSTFLEQLPFKRSVLIPIITDK